MIFHSLVLRAFEDHYELHFPMQVNTVYTTYDTRYFQLSLKVIRIM